MTIHIELFIDQPVINLNVSGPVLGITANEFSTEIGPLEANLTVLTVDQPTAEVLST
jgi:hypothetical protein